MIYRYFNHASDVPLHCSKLNVCLILSNYEFEHNSKILKINIGRMQMRHYYSIAFIQKVWATIFNWNHFMKLCKKQRYVEFAILVGVCVCVCINIYECRLRSVNWIPLNRYQVASKKKKNQKQAALIFIWFFSLLPFEIRKTAIEPIAGCVYGVYTMEYIFGENVKQSVLHVYLKAKVDTQPVIHTLILD